MVIEMSIQLYNDQNINVFPSDPLLKAFKDQLWLWHGAYDGVLDYESLDDPEYHRLVMELEQMAHLCVQYVRGHA